MVSYHPRFFRYSSCSLITLATRPLRSVASAPGHSASAFAKKSAAASICVTFRQRGHVTVFPSNADSCLPQCGQLAIRIDVTVVVKHEWQTRPTKQTNKILKGLNFYFR